MPRGRQDTAQSIYDDICRLSLPEKVALYEMIANDFEKAGMGADNTPSVPQVHVPRWLYRILARWS